MNSKNGPSQRQIRFSEVIREIISESIKGIYIENNKKEVEPFTVSFVKISKDLRIASIYIMPLGGIEKEKIIDLINKNKHKFQKALSEEKLKLKYIPKLKFYLDDTFDEADKIEKLLSNENVLRDLK